MMMDDNNILDDEFLFDKVEDSRNSGKLKLLRIEIKEKQKILKHGRIVLIALSTLTTIVAIFLYIYIDYFETEDVTELLLEPIVLTILYGFLAVFAMQNPKPVFIAALAIYIINTAFILISSVENIYSGIIFKIIIIYYLVKSIKAAFDLEKKILEYHQLGGQKDW